MTQAQNLADALSRLFTTRNASWFMPFTDAVAGMSAEQAAKVPAPRFNSVWMVVNHINFWQEIILKRLRNIEVDREVMQAGQGWEQPADLTDNGAWEATCERAIAFNHELTSVIARFTDTDLERPLETWEETRAQAIHGLIAHNSYHICEIISIRHMNGDWLEKA